MHHQAESMLHNGLGLGSINIYLFAEFELSFTILGRFGRLGSISWLLKRSILQRHKIWFKMKATFWKKTRGCLNDFIILLRALLVGLQNIKKVYNWMNISWLVNTDIIEESLFPRAQDKRGLSISNKIRNWRTKFIGRTKLKKLEKHWLAAGFEPGSGGCWGYCELCYTTLYHLHQTTIPHYTALHYTVL